jgi:threonylcarbamoyladenosine tRNA methylthiotransferase MtaB
MNKVALHTLGCKLNFSETSTIGKQFLTKGFEIVEFKEKADIYVFNTCTVTENAERECRQLVRRALRQNPDAFVIVTGCYAQLRPDEISHIEGVDVVLGSHEKFKLFSLIDSFQKKDLACIYVSPVTDLNEFGMAHSSDADSRTRAYFKIQDGCDYKCTFCTIPLARGMSRSMDPDSVISEFRKLVSEGYKEIILTGVNVGDYGKALNTDLTSMIKRMISVEGDFRLRISSIEPNLITEEIIRMTAESDKLCNHFHIPLQSGSPEILKLMRRRYTVPQYSEIIHSVKKNIPEAGIGVDVIVGFPGETEEHFLETYNFLKDLPVSYLHVFTYSERPDTPAAGYKNNVPVNERRRRNNMLRILSEKKRFEFYQQMINKKLSVLFETENANGYMKGFSSNYIRVIHPYEESRVNVLSKVLINGTDGNCCTGNFEGDKNSVDLLAS